MQMQQNDSETVRELSRPLYESKFWLKLVAVMMLVYGALTAITVVGLIVAWLPIWMGVLLFQTASAAEAAQTGGDRDEMLRAMSKLKTYFTIMGVLTLVGIVIMALGLLFGGLGVMTGLGDMEQMQQFEQMQQTQ